MLDRRMIILGGKGGVGRTTVAAALATLLARRGRRVLLAHVRTKQRMSQLLGSAEIDETVRLVEPNLWVVNMNPQAALREKGLMVLRFKTIYRAVLENRIVKYFLRAVPSLNEYAMLGKAWYHTTEAVQGRPRFETVVFDGPAMGHLVTMLRIPQVITETVPEGPLVADAREVLGLLQDPARTSLWIVTLAEEMSVREAEELYSLAVGDLRVPVGRLVVNALYPDDFERQPGLATALDELAHAEADPELCSVVASSQILRCRRALNLRYLRQIEERLPLPRTELPHLFAPQLDRACVDQLATVLEASL